MKGDFATQYDLIDSEFSEGSASFNDPSRNAFYPLLEGKIDGKKVLDVGCGEGVELARFSAQGARCYGLDSAYNMVERSQRAAPLAEVSRGVMEDIPFEDESFDHVISKYALQLSDDVPRALSEMGRVLRRGGLLTYLSTHPMRQFMEKLPKPRDYFRRETVESRLFEGRIISREPSHTLQEYLNPEFLAGFDLLHFEEGVDFPSSERIDGEIYPCFLVVQAVKK